MVGTASTVVEGELVTIVVEVFVVSVAVSAHDDPAVKMTLEKVAMPELAVALKLDAFNVQPTEEVEIVMPSEAPVPEVMVAPAEVSTLTVKVESVAPMVVVVGGGVP
jgi:hypothetical protein